MKSSFSVSTLILALCSIGLAGSFFPSSLSCMRSKSEWSFWSNKPLSSAPTSDVDVAVRDAQNPVQFIDISDTLTNGTTHERRGGEHYARFCEGSDCNGNFAYANNFGCGGFCWNGFSANSVLLWQYNYYAPKPTGSLYTSGDCTGSYQSVGIEPPNLTGCTNSNIGTWHSAYLYWDC